MANDAAAAGTVTIGGDLAVNRMGFGAMRITGPSAWGPPSGRDRAIAALRRAADLGVNFIDTADSYGPGVSEELITEALHPYQGDLVIATKGGLARPVGDIRQVVSVASVQNRYNAADRWSEEIVDLCESEGIAFLPWAPMHEAARLPPVVGAARLLGVGPEQVALAWLLGRSPQVVLIPGSGWAEHVAANIAAASLELASRRRTRPADPAAGRDAKSAAGPVVAAEGRALHCEYLSRPSAQQAPTQSAFSRGKAQCSL